MARGQRRKWREAREGSGERPEKGVARGQRRKWREASEGSGNSEPQTACDRRRDEVVTNGRKPDKPVITLT